MLVVRVVGVLTNIPRLSQANYSLLTPAPPGLAGPEHWPTGDARVESLEEADAGGDTSVS